MIEHNYYNIDGTVENKLSNNNQTTLSQKKVNNNINSADLNATYQCTWCREKNIKGVFNGYDIDGRQPTNMDINWHKDIYKEMVEKEDYQNAVKPLENLMR